jgi:hypothetical protein
MDKLITQNKYPKNILQQAINRFTHQHKTNYPISQQELKKLLFQSMENIQ